MCYTILDKNFRKGANTMKLDIQGRLTIPISLFDYLNFTPSDSIKISYYQDHILIFRANDISMENVEFHRITHFDERHRIFIGKQFIKRANLNDKDLLIGVHGRTIVIRW